MGLPGLGIVEAFGAVTDAAANLVGGFGALSASMLPFVQAFSPAIVGAFGAAMHDLAAVIGVALAPAMEVLTLAVRDAGDVLLPLMRQLRPILQDLAFSGLRIFRVMLEAWANQMQALIPLFGLFAEA